MAWLYYISAAARELPDRITMSSSDIAYQDDNSDNYRSTLPMWMDNLRINNINCLVMFFHGYITYYELQTKKSVHLPVLFT